MASFKNFGVITRSPGIKIWLVSKIVRLRLTEQPAGKKLLQVGLQDARVELVVHAAPVDGEVKQAVDICPGQIASARAAAFGARAQAVDHFGS